MAKVRPTRHLVRLEDPGPKPQESIDARGVGSLTSSGVSVL